MLLLKNGSTAKVIPFFMADSSDHVTGKAGVTPTVTISKNGAAFGSPTGTVAEVANGWYKLTPAAGDVDTNGEMVLHETGTGADQVKKECLVVPFDPYAATNLGLSALPTAAPQAAGGLITSAAGSLDMDDLAADVDAAETRVTLALPAAAPQAAGGLITSTAGSLDIDEAVADIDSAETRILLALPAVAPAANGGLPTVDASNNVTLDKTGFALASNGVDLILMSDITAVPGITATFKQALNWLFCLARNKRTQTATTETVMKDNGTTPICTSTKSSDGTTFSRGKYS